jgi:hypothetical protein
VWTFGIGSPSRNAELVNCSVMTPSSALVL